MSNQPTILAWHFVRGNKLRNGGPIPPVGKKLIYDGQLEMCKSGLHASRNIIDALLYAPGFVCCRVEINGHIIEGADKLVASERTILWKVNVKNLIIQFAKDCAKDVLHLWKAPKVVIDFLYSSNAADAADAASANIKFNRLKEYNVKLETLVYQLYKR